MVNTEYYQSLPKKRMAVGVLFFNTEGKILMVNPTYKDHWEVPGGVVELNESLKAAAEREIKEELGLTVNISDLLCVDYVADSQGKGDSLQFLFDGGVISDKQIGSIKLQSEELSEHKFFDPANFNVEMSEKIKYRISRALEARKAGKTAYIENPYQ